MAEGSLVDGKVIVFDYTYGHKAPVTVSRLGNWTMLWGRQDFIVYLAGVPVFMLLIATIRVWWPWFAAPFGGVTGGVISVAIIVALPVAAGWGVSMTGLRTRDLPRLAVRAASLALLPFAGEVSGARAVRREPHLRLALATYVIPYDAAASPTLSPEA